MFEVPEFENQRSREELRESGKREEILRDFARRKTSVWDLTLRIKDAKTSYCRHEEGSYSVTITSREFEQTWSNMVGYVWDYILQRYHTLHESGHVLFTDFDHYKELLKERDLLDDDDEVPDDKSKEGKAYSSIHNWFEDGRLEQLLIGLNKRWGDYIVYGRKNMFPKGFGDLKNVKIWDAIFIGVLDNTDPVDTGTYDSLIDPEDTSVQFQDEETRETFMEHINDLLLETADNVRTEKNAEKANQLIFEFVDEVIEYIDEVGEGQSQFIAKSGDAEMDEEEIEEIEIPEEIEIEDEEEFEEEVEQLIETEEGSDSSSEGNALDQLDAVSRRERNEQVLRDAKNLRDRLLQRLNITGQKPMKMRTNTERGTVDPRNLYRVETTNSAVPRINREMTIKDEPDSHIIFVIDRSGSMYHNDLRFAEKMCVATCLVFEKYAKVKTTVLDLYDNSLEVAKEPNETVKDRVESLTRGYADGGTPLSDALEHSNDLITDLNIKPSKAAVFVITDGKPDNTSRYETELQQIQSPVIGLSVDDSVGQEWYNQYQHISNGDEVQILHNLLKDFAAN